MALQNFIRTYCTRMALVHHSLAVYLVFHTQQS
jgi:hypothetical protein